MPRTRVKICGITREADLLAALDAGADAIGFVFYPPSPRYLDLAAAAHLAARVPPFVTRVGLFVNATPAVVHQTLAVVPLEMLQFHGDETPDYCGQFGRPYLRVLRVKPESDLIEFAAAFPAAHGVLLDAWVEGYGGMGQSFDWSLIPDHFPRPLVLSGGLDAGNVGEAIGRVRPWAVDVSSGVEEAKGIKNRDKIAAFIAAVRAADAGR